MGTDNRGGGSVVLWEEFLCLGYGMAVGSIKVSYRMAVGFCLCVSLSRVQDRR